MSGFLEEFDRRAKNGTPGQPPAPPQDLPAEDRELLEFADLIRAKRAAPSAEESRKLLDQVRAAEARRARPGTPARARTYWLLASAAALLCLAAGLWYANRPRAIQPPVEARVEPPIPEEVAVRKEGAALAAKAGDLAGLDFPTPDVVEGEGADTVEAEGTKDAARLLRVRGLVMVLAANQKQWRVATRGTAVRPGDTVRTCPRLESSTRILAPDGTAVSLRAGTTVRFDGQRTWQLTQGCANFEVAKRADLAPFTVTTPQGLAQALGTQFMLEVQPGATPQTGATFLWVAEGKVALGERGKEPAEVAAGQWRALQQGQATTERKLDQAWLDLLNRELTRDYGVGQLLAQAEKDAEKMPLEIKSYKVTATAVDQVARTFIEMVFVNHTDRRLEGTFYYPLPAEASVSEFSMYVGEQLIQGEVVEQQKARQVFEYIRREQRDPALLEFAGGNLFKMRVYPIEPRSEKRVQLGYTQVLPRRNGQVAYTFPLYSEMLLKNPLEDLTIEFRAFSSAGLDALKSPTHRCPGKLNRERTAGALGFRAKKYSPGSDFTVTYEVPEAVECVAFANQRPDEAQGYFMLQLEPRATLTLREAPERLLVIVDGSASAGPQEYAIGSEFAAAAADLSANWELAVLRGGQRPTALGKGFAPVGEGTSVKVRDFFGATFPLGATDLLATFRAAAERLAPGQAAQLVYVGDGIDTVSELSGPALVQAIVDLFRGKDVKVSTVAVGSSYDRQVLQGIAAALGGTFMHLEGADSIYTGADQVLHSFYRPVLRNAQLRFEGVEAVNVYPEKLGTIFVNDTVVVLGRVVKGGQGRVLLTADSEGQPINRSYAVDLTGDLEHNRFLPRLWARAHIEALLSQFGLEGPGYDAKLREQIIAVSVNYQIMSPYTSFLVLESEEDYARFGITRRLKQWDWTGQQDGLSSNAPVKKEGKKKNVEALWDGFGNDGDWLGDAGGDFSDKRFLSLGGGAGGWAAGRAFGSTSSPVSGSDFYGETDELGQLDDHFETFRPLDSLSEDRRSDELSLADGDDLLMALPGEDGEKSLRWQDRDRSYDWAEENESFSSRGLSRTEPLDLASSSLRARRSYGYYRGYSAPRYQSLVFTAHQVGGLEVDLADRSAACYQRLLSHGPVPDAALTRLNLALAQEREGHFVQALQALAPVIEKFPTVPELWLEQAVLHFRTGNEQAGRADLAKAVEVAPEKDRPALRERVALLLAQLNRYADSAEAYTALARQAETPEQAVSHASNAAGYFVSAQQTEKGRALNEELLKKYPGHGPAQAAAGAWFINFGNDPKRGLELLRAARQAGAPDMGGALVSALFKAGLLEEGRAECARALKEAKDAPKVSQVLFALYGVDRAEGLRQAADLLLTATEAHQLQGAAALFYCYQGITEQVGAVVKALERKELPPLARLQLYSAVLTERRRGGEAGTALPKLPVAVVDELHTTEELDQAARVVQQLTYAKARNEALELAARLEARADLTGDAQGMLANAEYQALSGLHRTAEAEEKLAAFCATARTEAAAYGAASTLFWSRLNRRDVAGAANVAAELAARFPDTPNAGQLYSYLVQRGRAQMPVDDWRKLVKQLHEAYPRDPYLLQLYLRQVAGQGDLRQAARLARDALQLIEQAPARKKTPEAEPPKPPAAPPAGEAKDPKAAEARKAEEEKRRQAEAEQKLKAEAQEQFGRQAQRARLISMLATLSSQDAELREAFLNEAGAKAPGEDPGLREWTEAALTCLRSAGEMPAYAKRLEALVKAEPRDPFWTRRLAGLYLATNRKDEGRKLLAQLFEAQPDDSALALQLQRLCEVQNDPEAAEGYFQRALDALTPHPYALQEFAQRFGQVNSRGPVPEATRRAGLERALRAWERLKGSPGYGQGGYPEQQVAAILEALGRDKLEVARAYLAAVQADKQGNNAGSSSRSNVERLAKDETVLRALEPEVRQALEARPAAPVAVSLNLLLYAFDKLLNKPDAAQAALEAAMQVRLAANEYNVAMQVVEVLRQADPARAEQYALEGGGVFPPDSRNQIIRQLAQNWQGEKVEVSIRLMRKALENTASGTYSRNSDRRYLVDYLVQAGRIDEAEQEVRKMLVSPESSWEVHEAWQRLVGWYRQRNNYDKAIELAREYYQAMRAESGSSYRSNATHALLSAYDGFYRERGSRLKTDAALRQQFHDDLMTCAKDYLSGTDPNASWYHIQYDALENLGVLTEVENLAQQAGASPDFERVMLAANYYRGYTGDPRLVSEAKRLYRRALTLDGADKARAWQGLWDTHNSVPEEARTQADWTSALEVLEKLRQEPSSSFARGDYYLQQQARCLYGLDRRDEARAALRKLINTPAYLRNYGWDLYELARMAERKKDWEVAAEVYEVAIRRFRSRWRPSVDAGDVQRLYTACANAYAEAGKAEAALDCYLRALSLIPRSSNQYKDLVDAALKRVLKGGALDKAVDEYQQQVSAAGGVEKPQMRLVFAAAYRAAGQTLPMLANLRIASRLLPKDTELRQQVIAGFKELGDRDSALAVYREWAQGDPQNIDLYRGLGDLFTEMGRPGDALLAWATMAEVRPREAEGYRGYAQKLVELGRSEEAAVNLRKAIRYRPTVFEISQELAAVYQNLNQKDRTPALWTAGEQACRKAMADLADDPAPWLDLGRFLTAQGKTKEAQDLYHKILDRNWPRFQGETKTEARKRLEEMR